MRCCSFQDCLVRDNFAQDFPLFRHFFFLPFVIFRHNPIVFHANAEAFLESAILTMFSGSFSDGAILILGAIKRGLVGHTPSEKGPAWIANNGSVMHMVVGNVATHLTSDLADEFGSFPFGFFWGQWCRGRRGWWVFKFRMRQKIFWRLRRLHDSETKRGLGATKGFL